MVEGLGVEGPVDVAAAEMLPAAAEVVLNIGVSKIIFKLVTRIHTRY